MINPILFISMLLMSFIFGVAIGFIIILIIVLSQRAKRQKRYAYANDYLRNDINSDIKILSENERRSVDGLSANDNF